jgi:hypothetical protein
MDANIILVIGTFGIAILTIIAIPFLVHILFHLDEIPTKSMTFSGYYERFIAPTWKRGLDAGIPMLELEDMMQSAIDNADPTIVGYAPDALFRNMVDKWIEDNK